jgi:hypothetical protein
MPYKAFVFDVDVNIPTAARSVATPAVPAGCVLTQKYLVFVLNGGYCS